MGLIGRKDITGPAVESCESEAECRCQLRQHGAGA